MRLPKKSPGDSAPRTYRVAARQRIAVPTEERPWARISRGSRLVPCVETAVRLLLFARTAAKVADGRRGGDDRAVHTPRHGGAVSFGALRPGPGGDAHARLLRD